LAISGSIYADSSQNTVYFKNHCFYVELAQTAEEKAKGLTLREHLDPDKGMLFIYKKERKYIFTMKNTLIPLDIIWINKDKEVCFIGVNIQPATPKSYAKITPKVKAKYVLELNAGIAAKIGLKIEDSLVFDIE